jgi:hypothetical protein
MQGSNLSSAKQAGYICGIDDTDLQVALDRGYVRATVVPQGGRTYRRFTKDQIGSLWAFRRMVQDGIKPSMARVNLLKMEMILASAREFTSPVKYFVFRGGSCRPVFSSEELVGGLGDGWVLDYANLLKHLEIELYHVPADAEGQEL